MQTRIHAAGPTGQRSPGLNLAIAGYLAENPPAGGGGGVPVFATLAEALTYEAENPGFIALYFSATDGGDPGAGDGPEPAFRAALSGNPSTSTSSFSDVPLGDASPSRTVIVGVHSFSSSVMGVSASLDATPMTLDFEATTVLGHRHKMAFFSLEWPSGTSAALEVSFGGATSFPVSVFVYTSSSALTAGASYYTHVEAESISLTIAEPAAGTYPIAIIGSRASLTAPDEWVWTDATEDGETPSGSSARPTATTFSAASTASERRGLACVVYGPAT